MTKTTASIVQMAIIRKIRICFLAIVLPILMSASIRAETDTQLIKAPPETRQVGIAYAAWHDRIPWGKTWDVPQLGQYLSTELNIIRQHAAWLSDANVDFIYIDWSNNLNTGIGDNKGQHRQLFIEGTTRVIFDAYKKLQRHPKIVIMIGFPGDKAGLADGRLQRKADQVWNEFAANPIYENIYLHYLHYPLLLVYTGTPSPFSKGLPRCGDPRFTVRYMTGFVSQQPGLLAPGSVSHYGYWSWEDRGTPTVAAYQGSAEAINVVAAWRGDAASNVPAEGRRDGQTYRDGWARARKVGPHFALAGSFNEWSNPNEEPSAEIGKDIEPSHVFGMQYLDLLKKEATAFKTGIP
jgi:hypothetical protein